jgi:hypothetical protein
MNQSSNNTQFVKYVLELPLAIFQVTFLYRLKLTYFSARFNLHLHVTLHLDTLITLLPLTPFHFQTPNTKHFTPILLHKVLHVDDYSSSTQSITFSQY